MNEQTSLPKFTTLMQSALQHARAQALNHCDYLDTMRQQINLYRLRHNDHAFHAVHPETGNVMEAPTPREMIQIRECITSTFDTIEKNIGACRTVSEQRDQLLMFAQQRFYSAIISNYPVASIHLLKEAMEQAAASYAGATKEMAKAIPTAQMHTSRAALMHKAASVNPFADVITYLTLAEDSYFALNDMSLQQQKAQGVPQEQQSWYIGRRAMQIYAQEHPEAVDAQGNCSAPYQAMLDIVSDQIRELYAPYQMTLPFRVCPEMAGLLYRTAAELAPKPNAFHGANDNFFEPDEHMYHDAVMRHVSKRMLPVFMKYADMGDDVELLLRANRELLEPKASRSH